MHALALSDRKGRAILRTPLVGGDRIEALASLEQDANGTLPTTASEVPVRTLDEFALRNVDAMKIGVEGHKAARLEGARETIERERPVLVVEIEERHHPGRSEAIIAGVQALDYSVYYLRNGLHAYRAGTISALQRADVSQMRFKNPEYVNNFIFIPGEKRELRAAFG